jgi:hypothetical protein
MNTILPPAVGDKVSFKNERGYTIVGKVNNVIDGKVVIAVRRSRNSFGGGIYKVEIAKVTIEQRKGQVDPRQHSDKGLETLTAMKTVPADWGLAAIKWELRRVIEEVWVLCPLCAGGGQIGTLKGKVVPSHEAWNAGDAEARKSIRTCTQCPQVRFTRKGRQWFRENEETKVWEGTGGGHHGAAHSNNYSFMNGLIEEFKPIMKEVGVVQWAKDTKFDSRFGGGHHCALCSKDIPSGQFAPVTGKGQDGVIHGMWVGMDCARKFFGIKNFKEGQTVERPKEAK